MARNDNLTDLLRDIADSIRGREGSAGLIDPQEFPERIAALGGGSSGGGADGKHRVLFIDVDGEVLKEQYVEDGGAATAPPDPSREMCEFAGWSDGFAAVTADTEVYATYRSADGKTRYRVDCPAGAAMGLAVRCDEVGCEATIDWGDGTSETVTMRGSYDSRQHVFAAAVNGWVTVSATGKHRVSVPEEAACPYVLGVVIGGNVEMIGSAAREFTRCGWIVVPDTVTAMEDSPFQHCVRLRVLVLPDSIAKVQSNTASVMSALERVRLPRSLKILGDNFLRTCSSLQSVALPDGVTSIGQYAFQSCSSLQSVAIPDGVTSIGTCAFQNCYSLRSVAIPDGVTSIGGGAFQGCSSLQSVAIPDGVTSIGQYAFQGCYSLQSVALPDGVTSIGACAFQNCHSLRSVALPDGVTSIGASAFQGCYRCAIDASALAGRTLGHYAFEWCRRLTGAAVLTQTTALGYGVLRKTGISSVVTAASSVPGRNGDEGAFSGCQELVRAELTNAADVAYALRDCPKLALVVLGGNMTAIGACAMENCPSLERLVVRAAVPPTLVSTALSKCPALAGIYVPDESVEAYKTATNWTAYASIIRPLSEFSE